MISEIRQHDLGDLCHAIRAIDCLKLPIILSCEYINLTSCLSVRYCN